MDLQKAFDTAAPFIIRQGRQAKRVVPGSGANTCALRGADGARCFVGALIPDKDYSEAMEGEAGLSDVLPEEVEDWTRNTELAGALTRHFGEIDERAFCFLGDGQNIHDSETIDPKHWLSHLRNLAAEYGLDASCLDHV